MTIRSLRFDSVTFAFDRASEPLFQGLSAHFSPGWTGVVGANGVGKTTILKLAARLLSPRSGQVLGPTGGVYCDQRTDVIPPGLAGLCGATERDAVRLRARLGVRPDWPSRWESLSHGERKRAQIAEALWHTPPLLLLDEPTNHLDADARKQLADALAAFAGVGIIVSHDRDLLDLLCHQCLFIVPPETTMRPGTFSDGSQQAAIDRTSAIRRRAVAKQDLDGLLRVAQDRAHEARMADHQRSKKGLARHDSDGRARINAARVSGKDGAAGRRSRQLEGRIAHARARLDDSTVTGRSPLGIWLDGAVSRRTALFSLAPVTLDLGRGRTLAIPQLSMKPTERIAVTGANGTGKSSLVRHILRSVHLEAERLTYIPQEIDGATSRAMLDAVRSLPGKDLGQAMIVVSRLGSLPARVLATDEPSPGEIRKVLLASGIAKRPHLIIMDEPTNHLDLPSIECLEDALMDCPCGLLLVSHDMRFLGALTSRRWHIEEHQGTPGRFAVREA